MRIVLDTNVLVCGLLNPNGAPGRIIDLILGSRITLLYDDRIIGEYEDVLARPQLKIAQELATAILGFFRISGERIKALPLPIEAIPDCDDLPFAEVAITGKADVLVTGNLKHFIGLEDYEITILAPAQFIQQLSES